MNSQYTVCCTVNNLVSDAIAYLKFVSLRSHDLVSGQRIERDRQFGKHVCPLRTFI